MIKQQKGEHPVPFCCRIAVGGMEYALPQLYARAPPSGRGSFDRRNRNLFDLPRINPRKHSLSRLPNGTTLC